MRIEDKIISCKEVFESTPRPCANTVGRKARSNSHAVRGIPAMALDKTSQWSQYPRIVSTTMKKIGRGQWLKQLRSSPLDLIPKIATRTNSPTSTTASSLQDWNHPRERIFLRRHFKQCYPPSQSNIEKIDTSIELVPSTIHGRSSTASHFKEPVPCPQATNNNISEKNPHLWLNRAPPPKLLNHLSEPV